MTSFTRGCKHMTSFGRHLDKADVTETDIEIDRRESVVHCSVSIQFDTRRG